MVVVVHRGNRSFNKSYDNIDYIIINDNSGNITKNNNK